jgi:hypothetical protein
MTVAAAAMADAGDGAGGLTRRMLFCMLRAVGSHAKINTKWFEKHFFSLLLLHHFFFLAHC